MDPSDTGGNPDAPATPPTSTPPATPPAPAPVNPTPAPSTPPAPAADQTFTQKQVNAIAAKEKNDARAAFLTELGVGSIDEAKSVLAAQREAEDAAKSEAERLRDQAARDAATAQAAMAEAARLVLEANIVTALTHAGITDPDQRTELVPLVAAKVSDDIDAGAAVELVKQRLPQLFQAPASATPPPSGDVRGGIPPTPTGTGGAWERGVAMAKAEKERVGVGFDPATFSLKP
jgi:hypothetical protein